MPTNMLTLDLLLLAGAHSLSPGHKRNSPQKDIQTPLVLLCQITMVPHPHPNPPLEGEGISSLLPLQGLGVTHT